MADEEEEVQLPSHMTDHVDSDQDGDGPEDVAPVQG
jgi:hypothetical protein